MQQLVKQHGTPLRALRVSGPSAPVTSAPVAQGDFRSVVALGLDGSIHIGFQFKNLRTLCLQHLEINTPQSMLALLGTLQGTRTRDVVSFKHASAALEANNIVHTHPLIGTCIHRIVFDHCTGVDMFLAYMGIAAGADILVKAAEGRIMPCDSWLQGELEGYNAAVVTVAGNTLQVKISKGTTTLTAEWPYPMENEMQMIRTGREEQQSSFGTLMEGIPTVRIVAKERARVAALYCCFAGVQELQLDFRDATLGMVAEDVARSTGVAIRVADGMASRPFTGTLRVDRDADEVVRSLAGLAGASSRRDGPGFVIEAISAGAR